MPHAPVNLHGTALVIGETGLLIIGESGAGKSSLALALIEAARTQGLFCALVSDDRVLIEAQGQRVLARSHPIVAGQIEARGAGIIALPHVQSAAIDALIVLADAPARMPEADESPLAGLSLPTLRVRRDVDLSAKCGLVNAWLRQHLQTRRN